MVKDEVGGSPAEPGVSMSLECHTFPFMALTLWQQEGHPAQSWVLVCWW